MTIENDYYIQNGRIFFSIIDKDILYKYEWSHENLKITESISFIELCDEKIKQLKSAFKSTYQEKVDLFYHEIVEDHKKKGYKEIEQFFDSFLQKDKK